MFILLSVQPSLELHVFGMKTHFEPFSRLALAFYHTLSGKDSGESGTMKERRPQVPLPSDPTRLLCVAPGHLPVFNAVQHIPQR